MSEEDMSLEEWQEMAKRTGHNITISGKKVEIGPKLTKLQQAEVACKGFKDKKQKDSCKEGFLKGYKKRDNRQGTVTLAKKGGVKSFLKKHW